jgi:uncharacterized protein YbjT (DUF2867 family)
MSRQPKAIPSSILVFGAAAHIGRPLAAYVTEHAPQVHLRLASSSPQKAEMLRADFPGAEVTIANFFDSESINAVVSGMEGVFMLTPSGTDESPVLSNLIAALRKADCLVQIIRLLGMQPQANDHRIPQSLRDHGHGLPIQHPLAKRILDDSGLPVTYLNSGATFTDGLLAMRKGIQTRRTLIWPERKIPHIDPRDIGEVAARLLLSDEAGHIGQFHTMNNGHDILRFAEVAALMSELWGEPISYDSSRQAFIEEYGGLLGEPRANYLYDFFMYEAENEEVWARNDFVERILGRKPRTVRQWLMENRDVMLGLFP